MSGRSRRRQGGILAALAFFLAFVAFAYGRDPQTGGDRLALPAVPYADARSSNALERAAGSAGQPRSLSDPDGVSRYSAVLRPVAARARPSAGARVVARLDTRTPEGTTNVVLALSRVERGGRLWIRARLPVLPNNTVGWIPREELGGYNTVNTHLVLDLSELRATLFRRGRSIFTARVGVGRRKWPTPTGEFYIRNRLTKFASPLYGPVAFGTSARSAVLTDWPAGGYVGIHGTNEPQILPGRVSHGCIRLRNGDILRLARLMPPGTPLTIAP